MQFRTIRRLVPQLAPALSLLIGFLPFMTEVASAQELRRELPSKPLPAIADRDTAHRPYVNLSPHGSGPQDGVDADVTRGSLHARFHFGAKDLTFGDGYSLTFNDTVQNGAELVRKLVATAPDGRRATAVAHYNQVTGRGDVAGRDKVLELIGESGDFALVREVLPLMAMYYGVDSDVAARATRFATRTSELPAYDVDIYIMDASIGWVSCLIAVFAFVYSVVQMIALCGTPEPLEPAACLWAISRFVMAGLAMANACS